MSKANDLKVSQVSPYSFDFQKFKNLVKNNLYLIIGFCSLMFILWLLSQKV